MYKSKIVKFVCICLVCLTSLITSVSAQEKPDGDAMFLKARDAAFNDRWPEARRLCRELLAAYPDYYDAIALIGRTYAWELKADSCRMTVMPLLDIEPDSHDILSLLADNEIWSGFYDKGLEIVNQALDYYPSDEDFLFRKATAYNLKRDNENAEKALAELFAVNPNHERGKELLTNLTITQYSDLYNKAEEETKSGNYATARSYCRQLLAEEPEHFPAKLLMAQNFAFENKFDSARIVSSELHDKEPKNYDVLDLMVNIEIWDRKYKAAMKQVNEALEAYPDDDNFLYKKALIQYLTKDYNDALKTLDHLLDDINPEHEDGIKLRDEILKYYRYRDYVFLESYFEYYKEPYLSRKLINSTGLAKWTKYGTYIGRVNFGEDLPYYDLKDRGKKLAFQYELEAYQNLFSRSSLWLNYAFSPNESFPFQNYAFFPKHRGGIEFFQGLPKGFEVSLGMRFLYWEDVSWIYTGSISWTGDKNYWAYRLFITPPEAITHVVTYRRYFSPRPEYFFALLGWGNYSDEFMLLNAISDISVFMQAGIHKFITPRWFFLASVGWAHDNYLDNRKGLLSDKPTKQLYRPRYTVQAGVRYYFNMFK